MMNLYSGEDEIGFHALSLALAGRFEFYDLVKAGITDEHFTYFAHSKIFKRCLERYMVLDELSLEALYFDFDDSATKEQLTDMWVSGARTMNISFFIEKLKERYGD